jgi:hypothetical protein
MPRRERPALSAEYFTAMRSVASVERVLYVVGSLAGLDPEVFRFAAVPVDQGRPEILS